MLNNLRDTTDIGGNDRQPAGHGFEKHIGRAFVVRGQYANVGLSIKRRHVGDPAEEFNSVREQPQGSGLFFQLRSELLVRPSWAGDQAANVQTALMAKP